MPQRKTRPSPAPELIEKKRECLWCNKVRKYKFYTNKYKKICIKCLTIRIKKGKFIISFD